MKLRTIYMLAGILILGSTARSQTTMPGVDRYARFSDSYRILQDRNIFSRARIRSDSSRSSSGRDRRDYSSSRSDRERYALRGVVKEDGEYRAFIEDTRTGATTRYNVGSELGQGKITSIGIDSLEFSNGSQDTRIDIGMGLDGRAATVASYDPTPTTSPTATGATTNPTDGSAPAAAAPISDVAERMKRARMQEIKQ